MFNVVVYKINCERRILAIKEIRAITHWGLKDSKVFTDPFPNNPGHSGVLFDNVTLDRAVAVRNMIASTCENIKARIEESDGGGIVNSPIPDACLYTLTIDQIRALIPALNNEIDNWEFADCGGGDNDQENDEWVATLKSIRRDLVVCLPGDAA